MTRHRVAFAAGDTASVPQPLALGFLRAVIITRNGEVPIDFTGVRVETIAKDLAYSLYLNAPGLRKASVRGIAASVRAFLTWLDRRSDVASGIETPDLAPSLLMEYEMELRAHADSQSSVSNGIAKVLKTLRGVHEQGIRELPDHLLKQASGITGRWGASTPIEPYSDAELRQIRRLVLAEMREALKRWRAVDGLLTEPWRQVGTWAAADWLIDLDRNGPRLRPPDYTPDPKPVGWPDWDELVGSVFPGMAQVVPFIIQIYLTTGIEPAALHGLTLDRLTFGRGADGTLESVTLTYPKYRSGQLQSATFYGRSRLSPPKLFDTVIALTARARRHAPEGLKDRLILVSAGRGATAGTISVPSGALRIRAVRAMVKRYQVRADHLDGGDEAPFLQVNGARLRKNYWARSYREARGDLRLATRGRKTLDVADEHYFRIEHFKGAHEATIAAGLQQAFAVKPRVASDASVEAMGGEDTWFARCTDFTHSPWSADGQDCSDPVLGCLFCPNAVFAPAKLPAVMHLMNFMLQQREVLVHDVWFRRWGRPLRQLIDGILPQFDPVDIISAREAAERTEPLMFLPIEMRNVKP